MKNPIDQTRGQLVERCAVLMDRVKLLRDYATSPGDVWLARNELVRIQELTVELETLLGQIKDQEEA